MIAEVKGTRYTVSKKDLEKAGVEPGGRVFLSLITVGENGSESGRRALTVYLSFDLAYTGKPALTVTSWEQPSKNPH